MATIRKGRKEDLFQCYQIDQICFQEHIAYDLDHFYQLWDIEPTFYVVEAGIADAGVAEAGQDIYENPSLNPTEPLPTIPNPKIIGFIMGYKQYLDAGNIITIDILPEYRRVGLGSQLISLIEEDFKRMNLEWITLQVAINNHPAYQLYLKLGYRKSTTLNHYYGKNQHAYLLLKSLVSE